MREASTKASRGRFFSRRQPRFRAGALTVALSVAVLGFAGCKKKQPSKPPFSQGEVPSEELASGSPEQVEVERLVAQQQYDQAVALAERHLQKRPEDPGLYYAKAAALSRMGKMQESRAALEQSIKVDEAFVPAHVALARELAFGGEDWEGGKRFAQKAVELAPRNPEAALVLAMILHDSGNASGAIEILEGIERKGIRDLGIYTELGRLYAARQDLAKARASLKAAIKMAPPEQSVPQRLLLGRIELSAGQDQAAKKHFDAARNADPKNWDISLAVVRAYLRVDKAAAAAPIAKAVVQALPDQAPALVAMGRVALAQGKIEGEQGALHWMQSALRRAPESLAAQLGQAQALAAAGRCEQAKKEGEALRSKLAATAQGQLDRSLAACKKK